MRLRSVAASLAVCMSLACVAPATAVASLPEAGFYSQVRSAQSYAKARVLSTEKRTPKARYTYYSRNGAWETRAANGWISGFLPGELWLDYQLTGDSWWRTRATARQASLGSLHLSSAETDLGFRYFSSYARGYRLTGDKRLRTVALRAAKYQAARYGPSVGLVRSRNTASDYHVIMDDMMNLQILWWGARNGGSKYWRSVAHQHALNTARDFIRPDGSTYHLVIYDPATGAVKQKTTSQGYSADSMWSRGQAWAIHGFATAYRETGDPVLLDAARRVSDRFLADVPPDMVPYWDFRAPNIPDEPRDSAAAAIAASGLIDLATTDPSAENRLRYGDAAKAILASLGSPAYLSVGSGDPAVLRHGTMSYWGGTADVGQSFGDYFFLEAMLRSRRLPVTGQPIPVRAARATKGRSGRAVDGSTATAWTSTGKQSLRLDLGAVQPVGAVSIAVARGDSRSAPLRISLSSDGKRYKLVSKTMSSGETAAPETYTFSTRAARYVRVEVSGTTAGKANALSEVRVY